MATLWSWVIALFLFGAVPAHAGSPKPISESRALQLQGDSRIVRAVASFYDMAQVSQGKEQEALLGIFNLGREAVDAVGTFLALAIIYQRMRSEDDKAEVARWVPPNLEDAKSKLDVGVEGINGYLMFLKSPAAIAEAQRVRDLMRELRRELDQYHY